MTNPFRNLSIHKFLVVSFFLLLLASSLRPLTVLHAEDVKISAAYSSPYGSYKEMKVQNPDESTSITDFTQSLTKAGINIITDYNDLSYTPGIFWSTQNDNPTKPKAGIWMYEATAGSKLFFGTSNNYFTGITNSGLVLDQNGRVGLGTTAPNEQLELTGNLRLPPTTATTGSLFVGPDRFLYNYDINNIFLGIGSGDFDTVPFQPAGTGQKIRIGSQGSVARSSTALGARAVNSSIVYGTAVGAGAMSYGLNGDTAAGYRASYGAGDWGLYSTCNVAIGSYALYSTTERGYNTAVGYGAMVSPDVWGNSINGDYNTALGTKALYSNASGNNNTALGVKALYSNTNGSSNVAVGNGTAENATGTTNPLYDKTVTGSVFLGYQAGQNGVGANELYIDNSNIAPTSSSGPLIYGSFSADTLQINGQVGIGTAPYTTYRLTLPNTANPAGQGIAKAWKTYSSIRWKENILPISDALEKVLQLRGVTYTRKESKEREVGMIAEEVGKVFPEIVDYEKNGTDAIGMSYDRLVAVLVEAVKELKVENQAIEKRIESLEKKQKN